MRTFKPLFIECTLALTLSSLAMMSANATFDESDSGEHSSSDLNSQSAMTSSQQQLLQDATYIKQALAYNNYAAIAPFIHPKRGVRFSMYAYVEPKSDKVFSRAQFTQFLKADRIKFTWGEQDGTGDLYITPLPSYLTDWVDGSRYKSIGPTLNRFQGYGNSLNNLQKVYPKADFVEFYDSGSDKYSGMDWQALRLVFEEYNGKQYLVAIINDQWTI